MNDEIKIVKEPIVLGPENGSEKPLHQKAIFTGGSLKSVGLIPKILISGAFIALLVIGLTAAGIAIGVFLVSLIAKTMIRPRKR